MATSLSSALICEPKNVIVHPTASNQIENYPDNDLNLTLSYDEDFTFSNTTCYICNGYYGPCFEETVCATCHTFLFPEMFCIYQPIQQYTEKKDDGDSGNDEPNDMYIPIERHQITHQGIEPVPRVDPVAVQLEMLSTPRDPRDITSAIVEYLPPEVLLVIFSYLDDMSLWSVSKVCTKWKNVLSSAASSDVWRGYTQRRWPLFKPICSINNWFNVYAKLMESCPCKICFRQMSLGSQTPWDESSWRKNRLINELKSLKTDPPEGIEAIPLDHKSSKWQATITGPVGSPYEGGTFFLYIQVPCSYPLYPPVVRFLTKIFHPNVSRHGDVGIDSIHHNWSLALTISKVLISVQSLLTDPYCEVCMEPSIGKLYIEDRTKFEDIARAWTWRYAMHDVLTPL